MDEAALIARITELARSHSAAELSEMTISLTHGDLYDAAATAFGGWDVALAEALKASLATEAPKRRLPTVAPDTPVKLDRTPHADALRPLVALTENGYLLATPARWIEGSIQPTTPRPLMSWPANIGRPVAFRDVGSASGFAALSDDGRLFGWDARLLPSVEVGESVRRLGAPYGVSGWRDVVDRDSLVRAALAVTVSAKGKVKASDADLLPRPVTADGTVVALVDDGDALVALRPLGLRDGLLLVASNGYAIHFSIEEVRPMGLRAAGVMGMKLRGDGRVISALVVDPHEEVAVISTRGFAKRMPLDEFRPQSRAGLGLQTAKLARKDRLVAAAGLSGVVDLLVTTDHGRCLRVPSEAVPVLGRPARGVRILELDDGESVCDLAVLLPMAFD